MTTYLSKRLLKLYNEAPAKAKQNSKDWYLNANSFAHGLAIQYLRGDLYKAVAVIAVLSPACSWEINKRDAETLIKAYYLKGLLGANKVVVSSYGQNKRKALAILNNEMVFTETKTNTKTFSFAHNIYKPFCSERVTIDRHAIKAYKGVTKGGSVTVSKKEYKQASEAYKALADHVGCVPCEVQAIVWDSYKTKVGR